MIDILGLVVIVPILLGVTYLYFILRHMGFLPESVAKSDLEFCGWMARYYHQNSDDVTSDDAYLEAFKVFKEYLKDERIEFGNARYSWTRTDAELLVVELLLRD